MNWLVFVIFLVLAVFCAVGFAKGLARMVIPLIAVVLAAALMWILMPMLKTKFIDKTELQQTAYEKIYRTLDSKVVDGKVPIEVFYEMRLPDPIEISVIEKYNSIEGAVSEKIEYTSRHLARIVVSVTIAGRIFLVFFVVLILLSGLLKLTFKPKDKLTTADHLLGGLLGLIEAVALVDLFFLLVTGLGYMGFGTGLMTKITNNWFTNLLYDHNILLWMIKGTYTPTFLY